MNAIKIYEDAVRKLEKSKITLGEFEQIIAPLRDVIQSKYGKWLPDNRCGGGYWVCSSCKNPTEAFAADVLYKYCPFCGADMRTKETDYDYERAVEQFEHDMLYESTFNPDDGSM